MSRFRGGGRALIQKTLPGMRVESLAVISVLDSQKIEFLRFQQKPR